MGDDVVGGRIRCYQKIDREVLGMHEDLSGLREYARRHLGQQLGVKIAERMTTREVELDGELFGLDLYAIPTPEFRTFIDEVYGAITDCINGPEGEIPKSVYTVFENFELDKKENKNGE